MRKLACWGLTVAAIALGSAHAQQTTVMSIGTGGTGGVWYPLGGAMANILTKTVPGMRVTAEVTGGSVDNITLIRTGRSELGFSMVDAAWDAYRGQGKFKEKVELRTLAVFYPQKNHVVTLEGSGIEKMADLRGKRVSVGSPGSGSSPSANAASSGLRPRSKLASAGSLRKNTPPSWSGNRTRSGGTFTNCCG